MRWSLQVQYGVYAMFDLAYNGREAPVQVRVIGERQAIPARYLEQIFQRLRRAKLVHGKRGPGGGYTLAREPRDVTLRDVVEAIEGPLGESLVPSPDGLDGDERHRPTFLWEALADRVGESLAATSLEDLCRQAARRAVERADADAHTWVI
ncbi:MAG: Rrf2 family transcriptional regulator [Myxococcales bacterium]|nr:Rrf2 family transcriptional regulator [Myxococcales bacterium]